MAQQTQEQDINHLLKVRREKLAELQQNGRDPFQITKFDQTHHSLEVKGLYEAHESELLKDRQEPNVEGMDEEQAKEALKKDYEERRNIMDASPIHVAIAGRMMFKRVMGKASFCNIQDLQGNIQVYVARDAIGTESYADFKKSDIGDIFGVEGFAFRTRTGEISIHAEKVTLLSKSLQILPEKFHGLTDVDTRYRQRYVDLIMNAESKDTFIKRSKILSAIRKYLSGEGFMEVETPMLVQNAGGAAARPFETHFNALNEDLKLRISLELYLKRLIVGGMERVFEQDKPDLILVHGDTSTTFAGALAAFYHQVKVGHVEAGLRTWDKYSPFPEEMNRTLVGDIADLHFSPTKANAENLRRESIMGDIFITGNTAIDAMRYTVRPDYKFSTAILNELDFAHHRILAVTCHRRENYGEPMENICRAIAELSEAYPDVHFVYPVHLSPYVRETAEKFLGGNNRIHLIHPLAVDEMHNLMDRCYLVMTDSGGLQEEAPALGKPVLVMRRETERPEAVEAGTVKLCGVVQDDIVTMAERLIRDKAAYEEMAHAVNPYGDGHACERIADAILCHFGRGEKPMGLK